MAGPALTSLLDPGLVTAAPGRPWALAFTKQVDEALRHLLGEFLAHSGQSSGGVAIVALGSYARSELVPRSDIDLLLLHDGWGARELEALVRGICYPLWDAGLSVGHAVRTTKDAVRSTSERVDTATALTDRRLIGGSKGLADDLAGRVGRWLRRSGGQLAIDIAEADAERHHRYGGSAGALEPELKDGIGGLRDLHSLRWAGAILLGEAGLDPLVGARYLGAADRSELAKAGEMLLAGRCALHLAGDKGVRNQLRLDLQDEVARLLGMADGDVLLRAVGLATRTIAHLHARTWPVLLEDATRGRRRRRPTPRPLDESITLSDGLVEVDSTARMAGDPSLGLRAVAAAARSATVVGRASAMRLRAEVNAAGTLRWDDRSRRALLEALSAGQEGLVAMADADYLGLMDAHLPEWSRVRGRPQRNPLHTFDLDTHALQAAAWLAAVAQGALSPSHADTYARLTDPEALVLGTWLHDVGKAWPGDHSVAGETVGRDWVLHMGFSSERADRVARLIRLHLLLPEAATQRDIDDPREIERVAVAVGDTETLDGLFLLSFADARATGKAAWSEWKDLLITRLYERVGALLTGEVGVLSQPSTPDVVMRAASRHGVKEADLRATVGGLPKRYLRVAEPAQLAAHARLLMEHSNGLLVDVRDGPVGSTKILSLVAPDRVGMVADCLGVLAAHRIDVLEARVFTHTDGTALDWFVVTPSRGTRWPDVVDELKGAYAGDLDVADAVRRREAERDARPPALAVPVPVTIAAHPYGNGKVTRIEVRGPDSPGVLYRLTRALQGMDANLLGAQIATLGPEVRDAFFVTGSVPAEGVLSKVLAPAFA